MVNSGQLLKFNYKIIEAVTWKLFEIKMKQSLIKLFLESLTNIGRTVHSLDYAHQWIKEQNEKVKVSVNQIPFKNLNKWHFDKNSLRHDSGKFFSIDGINVKTNYGSIHSWQQPIINQPEIGYLGIIVKEINGVLHFLMQAKIEPGNINHVQLSPTLQATKSNYTKVHKGKSPAYLECFRNAKPKDIIFDQLQSEQGARFLKKRNRNIIIKVDGNIEVKDNFIWLTLWQIKELMKYDNLVNMDTRTVISGILFEKPNTKEIIDLAKEIRANLKENFSKNIFDSIFLNSISYHSENEIIKFVTRLKTKYELEVKQIPIQSVENWIITDTSIHHKDQRYFEVIAVDIEIDSREVIKWSQPMVKPKQEGICAFICKKINGIIHFAVQAKLECGNFDIIEFAPTVQCLTGNYRQSQAGALPFLEYVLNAKQDQIIFDTLQSEEGGRFFREQNRNMIVIGKEDIPIELPDNHIWMTLNQLYTFLKFNNYLNIQARSLIAAISFV